jgi:hypothetical protein
VGPIYALTANFSSAVAHIFGIPVYMLLLPTVDQFTGQTVNKLLMWDGKRWFTSQQDGAPLAYIAAQEINSVLTAWGTDGINLFRLFQRPSVEFAKVVQSKLHSAPAYWTTKTATRLTGVVQSYALDNPLSITIDNEHGLGSGNALVSVLPSGSVVSVFNNAGTVVVVTNSLGAPVILNGNPGLDVFGPYPVGNNGRMVGLTVQTNASDVALLSFTVAEQVYSTNI